MSLSPHTKKLTVEDAAHFLRRTAFGASEVHIRALVGQDARTVAREALQFDQRLTQNPFDPSQGATAGAMIQLQRAAWLYEILYGVAPLREKLVLMWSNHFVVGTDKVKNYPALHEYLSLLRKHAATGNFTSMAIEISKTPAMLRYLDNDQNKKGKPNENFSRELLELFTTGIGHYTESDVREGARALSGWTFKGGRVNKKFLERPEFVFRKDQHDNTSKTYLGKKGLFLPEDIVRLASNHPQTAVFVCNKLHRTFVSDTPDERAVQSSAETFRLTNGNIAAVLEELLASEVFYRYRQSIIRGPVDYVVGMVRSLGQPGLSEKQVINLAQLAGKMGQVLLEPDTVKGWDGGREWINDTTLLTRMQVAAAMTLGKGAPRIDPPSQLALTGSERALENILTALTPEQRTYLTLISPEFQLA